MLTNLATDETRRSGRATKGQHTKDRDIPEPPKKKGTAKKTSKAKQAKEEEEEEPDEVIRCVCGEYEEETEVERAMVCCDNCDAWQHNDCMGLPEDYNEPSYFCERCKPANHKTLLNAMKKGQKPWEAAAKSRAERIAREAAEAQNKKKGKKGGRKSGATDEPASTPSATPVAGQKRKADESPAPSETKVRHRGACSTVQVLTISQGKRAKSTPKPTPSTESAQAIAQAKAVATPSPAPPSPAVAVPKEPSELPKIRQAPAATLIKLFVDQTKLAVKEGFNLPAGQTQQTYGSHLGMLIEHALQSHASQSASEQDAYKNQLQAIVLNVKRNHALGLRIVRSQISPAELAAMAPAAMASEEQQRKDAEMQAQLDKQSTLVGTEDSGPRIRRTHKGEEYVEDLSRPAPESAPKPPVAVRQPSTSEVKSPSSHRRPPSVTIPNNRRPSGDPRRQSSASNFDLTGGYSGMQNSPTGEQRFGELPTVPAREEVGPGAQPDPDIDNLLKDEVASGRSSPPYSPRVAEDDGSVWQGLINGGNVGRFHNNFKFAGGAPIDAPTLQLTWEQLLPNEIGIGGRIDPAKADDYLCGLEFSTTSDLIVLWMGLPSNPAEVEHFDRFFSYFKTKDRFGVGAQNHNPALKDIYFIPLDKGQQLPTFFSNLQTEFPQQAPERMILIPLVIKNSELPRGSNAGIVESPAIGGAVMQTPMTPHENQWHPDGSLNGSANINAYNSGTPVPMNGSHPSQQPQGFIPQQPAPQLDGAGAPSRPYSQQPSQSPAPAQPSAPSQSNPPPPATASPAAHAAYKILGPSLSASPAVQQLVGTAPEAGEQEMRIIGECITENPAAAHQLDLLTQMLMTRWAANKAGGSDGAGEGPPQGQGQGQGAESGSGAS
jgi:hypothetical protein